MIRVPPSSVGAFQFNVTVSDVLVNRKLPTWPGSLIISVTSDIAWDTRPVPARFMANTR